MTNTALSSSLLEPGTPGTLAAALNWIEGILLGSVGTTLAILSVAFVGFALLQGRLAVRDGVRVVLGCFVLFGAPLIGVSLRDLTGGEGRSPAASQLRAPPAQPPPLPRSTYDPYAGASLRDDSSGN